MHGYFDPHLHLYTAENSAAVAVMYREVHGCYGVFVAKP